MGPKGTLNTVLRLVIKAGFLEEVISKGRLEK